jgi:signal transduction histidine kinase
MAIPLTPLRKWSRTYGFRITLLYIALFGVCVLMLFAVIYWATAEFMEEQLRAAIDTEIASLVDDFGSSGIDSTIDAIKRRVGSREHEASYYLLQDAGGRKIAGNLGAMAAADGWYELPIPPQGDDNDPSDTLMAHGQVLPNGWFLLVGQDTDNFTDFEDLIVNIAAGSLAAAFALAVIGGLATSASMLRRVTAITDAGREIMRGNLARRIALRGNGDEFDRLSGNLNEMLDRIQMLMDGLRQVSNDIAHDLRTPLTRLRQRLELARAKATTVADYQAAVDQAIAETDEILDTFGALLRIAQIEAGTRRSAFTAVDLSGVLQTIVETYAAVAEDHHHQLASRIAEGVTVQGDRQLLTQMVANLVENALRHTPIATRIEVELAEPSSAPVCVIRDNGPGIPEPERQKVFRRFYRLDASRATPGSGLGLSLVAAVAELHRIAIEVGDNEPGLRVTLRFPEGRVSRL